MHYFMPPLPLSCVSSRPRYNSPLCLSLYLSLSLSLRLYIEAVDHKTPAQCAQLCLDDAGCKSFDSGVIGDFQEGDCFLSYDNIASARPGDWRSISQINYYEKLNIRETFLFLFSCMVCGPWSSDFFHFSLLSLSFALYSPSLAIRSFHRACPLHIVLAHTELLHRRVQQWR